MFRLSLDSGVGASASRSLSGLACACLVAGAVCCFGSNARAGTPQSFPEVFRLAEHSAPRLQEAEAEVQAAAGRARQSAAWLNPLVGVEFEDFAGSGPYRGSSNAQTTVSLSEPLEIGGQRSARAAAGRAELTAAQARRVQVRIDFGFELAMAYAAAEASRTRVSLMEEDLERAREASRAVTALVDAGKEAELRAIQAQAAVSAGEADLESARADEAAALSALSSLVGIEDPFTGVGASLLTPARVVSGEPPAPASPVAGPAIVTAEAERETAERRLKVEQRRAIPTPSLTLGARRLAGNDATAWVAGVSIPVPLFDRNRGAIAAARAELDAAGARLRATRLDTEAEWRSASAQSTSGQSRQLAADKAESSAREAYRLARIGYDAGRTPLYELLSTQRALTESRLRSLDARLTRLRAEASLARIAGRIPFIE
ncbi:MAG: TolC family protein [Steroidobacteraceae bacterium]